MKGTSGKHILAVRLSAMGDVAMTVPAIKALRQSNPDMPITVLTRSAYKPFFEGVSGIDFIEPDFDSAHKGLFGLLRLARQIRRSGITHIADLHDVLRTKIIRTILRLNGLKVASIDKGRAEKRVLTRKFRKELTPLETTVNRYCDVFRALGLELSAPEPPAKVKTEVPAPIAGIAGECDGRWVGIAPFAKHKAKIYPVELTCELIGLLSERYSKVFVFGGGQYEKQFAELMEQRHGNVISVPGRLNLSQEMALISNLEAVITMDSASMHIASLVGTRVVSVWGGTHPYAGFYGFGQDMADAVQLDMPCRPCSVYGNKQCIFKDYRCMARIAPADIIARLTGGM